MNCAAPPTEYKDTYRETLRAMIEQKIKGKEIAGPKLPGPKVTDLRSGLITQI